MHKKNTAPFRLRLTMTRRRRERRRCLVDSPLRKPPSSTQTMRRRRKPRHYVRRTMGKFTQSTKPRRNINEQPMELTTNGLLMTATANLPKPPTSNLQRIFGKYDRTLCDFERNHCGDGGRRSFYKNLRNVVALQQFRHPVGFNANVAWGHHWCVYFWRWKLIGWWPFAWKQLDVLVEPVHPE